ncbi:MAG: DUF3052 family protein [Actinobacteria bacterium]|uniref:Unannotated protein n=1 Tax=freshwater metagenome TaxID=449393 RepID=A0A6J6MXS7_9ZZZZ|nr:DUF3052 family protein [Actinomycetota bacterium]MSY04583.1 DUF3052 family protein [Actinomycetota bacterium]MSY67096.1 DUF3052 family protein [Actinomycetota bacterium]MTB26119.1 DUF3052 family protein [Actinomycetota bacterium]
MITRLGINAGDLILEIGEDSDCDQELRKEIFATSGNQPVGDDDGEVVDVVLLWWREEDGDLVDALVDSLTFLAVNGVIWLLTPKMGRPGHVEPSDIQDSAPTAGLAQASSFAVSSDWSATKLMAPKAGRR